jgi:predicted cation transporter
MFIVLIIILFAIFTLPLVVKKIEEQLEVFLFTMGVIAVTFTYQWSISLVNEGIIQPIMITLVVLTAGIIFRILEGPLSRNLEIAASKMGLKVFVFSMVVILGIVSAIITSIVAALLLVEIADKVHLGRRNEIALVVLSCYSIGLGSVLTPLGGPLAAIVIAKLQGAPYYAGFWFLFNELWYYILPGIIALGFLCAVMTNEGKDNRGDLKEEREEDIKGILTRTAKIYLFIMSLVFLGVAFKPLMETVISGIQPFLLYWINSVSAVLDNATLAAAEIWPSLTAAQISSAMLGLTLAGGMLIPGNIPNIISAGKLKIRSREWARLGVPLGIGIMLFYFVIMLL